MSHAKGPWKYEVENKTYYDHETGKPRITRYDWIKCTYRLTDGSPHDVAIASVYGLGHSNGSTREDDGKLIATAPELLEELECLIGNIKSWGSSLDGFRENCASRIQNAERIIMKAKGQL